ncbi:MAG: efflux RND transporter periplasmic adaptor subunit [Betaproteobacteria bacterium]|nr:efflux RND transporter periplasmic adaptor subunit [Betaproteobacteria bacterium]
MNARKPLLQSTSALRRVPLFLAALAAAASLWATAALAAAPAPAPALRTAIAAPLSAAGQAVADGLVEAVRQTAVSAPVAGTLALLAVQAGDRVQAGQVLARIDARAAQLAGQAGDAQVQAARASLEVARRTLARQRDLHGKGFISAAALDQAEAEFRAAEAGVNAQVAQAGVAHTQADFHVVRAPYAGVVADVPVVVGELAQPGRTLVTLYDPTALRVTATLAQSDARAARASASFRVEIAGREALTVPAARSTLLPAADPATQTVRLRLDLPASTEAAAPGTFARVGVAAGRDAPVDALAPIRIGVPQQAVVRRSEMTGVYVVRDGRAALRQVRLGPVQGADVEILSGISAGEAVALDPQAAARHRAP